MEARLIRMVTVPLMAGQIRPCLPELRSDERMSLPLTPIDAYPPAGLTLDDDRRSFSRTYPNFRFIDLLGGSPAPSVSFLTLSVSRMLLPNPRGIACMGSTTVSAESMERGQA
jgi:hypothetical protein